MEKKSENFSTQDMLRMASSPAGQQLIAMLRSQGNEQFQQAMAQASSGDYEGVKRTLSGLLSQPQVKKLLESLGGKTDG
jgi:hypothetical protein